MISYSRKQDSYQRRNNTREKPENTTVTDEAWEVFEEFADEMGFGDDSEDWTIFFQTFEKGFIAGLED